MPIPANLDVAYVYCALWIAVEVALFAIYGQLAPSADLNERVRVRTFRRLLPLNEYLSKLIEAWDGEDDLVPGADHLLRLKREVDRAAVVASRMQRRLSCIEFGRTITAGEVVAAFVTAALLLLGLDRGLLQLLALVVFGGGAAASVSMIVLAGYLGFRISTGEDYN
jgi:hypothetical protein